MKTERSSMKDFVEIYKSIFLLHTSHWQIVIFLLIIVVFHLHCNAFYVYVDLIAIVLFSC